MGGIDLCSVLDLVHRCPSAPGRDERRDRSVGSRAARSAVEFDEPRPLNSDDVAARPGGSIDELDLVVGLGARGWSVLLVSATTEERRIAAAIAAGAVGFVPKSAPLPELLDAVFRASSGREPFAPQERERWVQIDRCSRAADRRDRSRWRRLTSREREVLECLGRGERATAIAAQFVVSLTTVRAQIRSILTKLDVNSQLEAVALLHRVQGAGSGRPDGEHR
jgi:DNA-binding NarL/FixJ family response regulator